VDGGLFLGRREPQLILNVGRRGERLYAFGYQGLRRTTILTGKVTKVVRKNPGVLRSYLREDPEASRL